MYREITPREEKLLEFLNATGLETVMKAEINEANIDYVAMMTDVELPTTESEVEDA